MTDCLQLVSFDSLCRGVEPTGSKTVESLHKIAGDKVHIRVVVRKQDQAKPEWKKWGCEVMSSFLLQYIIAELQVLVVDFMQLESLCISLSLGLVHIP